MTIKELILTDIHLLEEEELEKVYALLKQLVQRKNQPKKQSFMSKLKEIQIKAPEDFASNLDGYLSGEKDVTPDFQ